MAVGALLAIVSLDAVMAVIMGKMVGDKVEGERLHGCALRGRLVGFGRLAFGRLAFVEGGRHLKVCKLVTVS